MRGLRLVGLVDFAAETMGYRETGIAGNGFRLSQENAVPQPRGADCFVRRRVLNRR